MMFPRSECPPGPAGLAHYRRSRRSTLWLEAARLLLIAAVAWWLGSPLLEGTLIGGGDAVWYHHQVADAITQGRAGQFPLWVGQSHFAANGAVHPHRTAPLLLNAVVVLDALTGREMVPVQLLNRVTFLTLLLALGVAYGALRALQPSVPTFAAAGAIIYVTSPGVVGLVYAQDLYMSMMTIPWVMLAIAATVKAACGRGTGGSAALGGVGLGLVWWSHPPIALWVTLALTPVVIVGGWAQWRRGEGRLAVKDALVGAATFGATAAYPVLSVLLLREKGEAVVPRVADREQLLREISQAFPQVLQPITPATPLLAFMQPGYSVLAVLVVAALWAARRRPLQGAVTVAVVLSASLLLALMLPVPWLTGTIWRALPEMWVGMTNIWPMQRLTIVIVALAVVAALSVRWWAEADPKRQRAAGALVMVAVLWSLWQAATVREIAQSRQRPAAEMAMLAREENANLSEYAYHQLPGRPATFIHGVTDPRLELRLLRKDADEVLLSNKEAVERGASEQWIPLHAAAVPGRVARFQPSLELEAGERYLLTFRFHHPEPRGVLRLQGEYLQRVYILPEAGERWGFGIRPEQEKSLAVWLTEDRSDRITIEFIPEAEQGSMGPFADVRLTPVRRNQLPVELTSLVPFEAKVRAPEPARVETFRMSIPGWRANVNGAPAPVQRSAQGLVAVPVPAGESTLRLMYQPPMVLPIVFWLGFSLALLTIGYAAIIGMCAGGGWLWSGSSRTRIEEP